MRSIGLQATRVAGAFRIPVLQTARVLGSSQLIIFRVPALGMLEAHANQNSESRRSISPSCVRHKQHLAKPCMNRRHISSPRAGRMSLEQRCRKLTTVGRSCNEHSVQALCKGFCCQRPALTDSQNCVKFLEHIWHNGMRRVPRATF